MKNHGMLNVKRRVLNSHERSDVSDFRDSLKEYCRFDVPTGYFTYKIWSYNLISDVNLIKMSSYLLHELIGRLSKSLTAIEACDVMADAVKFSNGMTSSYYTSSYMRIDSYVCKCGSRFVLSNRVEIAKKHENNECDMGTIFNVIDILVMD